MTPSRDREWLHHVIADTKAAASAQGGTAAEARTAGHRIAGRFADGDSAKRFATACNVLVTTPSALFASGDTVVAALLGSCSHLFVDEAHHVEARTWRRIRDAFIGKPVLQFTATPYREDGLRLDGRQIYNFKLRQAQRLGYFAPIDYVSVVDFAAPDQAIATQAVDRLRTDLAAGFDHILMARVDRIGRTEEIRNLYVHLAPNLAPVIVTSRLNKRDRQIAVEALDTRRSRIVICVDMLGEGFDLPALKVAAIHSPHKSLGVTLQYVGRFEPPPVSLRLWGVLNRSHRHGLDWWQWVASELSRSNRWRRCLAMPAWPRPYASTPTPPMPARRCVNLPKLVGGEEIIARTPVYLSEHGPT